MASVLSQDQVNDILKNYNLYQYSYKEQGDGTNDVANVTSENTTPSTPADVAENSTANEAADENTIDWGNKKVNKYYESYLKELSPNTIDYRLIGRDNTANEEIARMTEAYLNPSLKQSIADRRAQTLQAYSDLDADAASRGMSSSTWLSDVKNSQSKAQNADISSLYRNYLSNLNSAVATRRENIDARNASIDTQNAANSIEVGKWNSQVLTALEQIAYERALQAKKLSNVGGGGSRGGSHKYDDDNDEVTIIPGNDGININGVGWSNDGSNGGGNNGSGITYTTYTIKK